MRLNVQDAAALLHVSTKTIYRWVREGKLPGYRVQKTYRFDRAELLEWATANRIAFDPRMFTEAGDEAPIPAWDKALEAGGVHYRVGGATRDEVLRAVVETVRVVEEPDRDLLFEALRARDALASTSIGAGVGIPHLRNPLGLQIPRASVSLCFLEQPVDWHAPDGVPVGVLFVVVGPTVRAVLRLHVQTLFAMRDATFADLVLAHGARDALFAEARRVAAGFSGGSP